MAGRIPRVLAFSILLLLTTVLIFTCGNNSTISNYRSTTLENYKDGMAIVSGASHSFPVITDKQGITIFPQEITLSDALKDLNELDITADVDANVLEELKAELTRELLEAQGVNMSILRGNTAEALQRLNS